MSKLLAAFNMEPDGWCLRALGVFDLFFVHVVAVGLEEDLAEDEREEDRHELDVAGRPAFDGHVAVVKRQQLPARHRDGVVRAVEVDQNAVDDVHEGVGLHQRHPTVVRRVRIALDKRRQAEQAHIQPIHWYDELNGNGVLLGQNESSKPDEEYTDVQEEENERERHVLLNLMKLVVFEAHRQVDHQQHGEQGANRQQNAAYL